VTIEKINHKHYDIVYYVKEVTGKLRRIAVSDKEVSIKDKDPEGFTNVEVRFMARILKENQQLNSEDVLNIQKLILLWK